MSQRKWWRKRFCSFISWGDLSETVLMRGCFHFRRQERERSFRRSALVLRERSQKKTRGLCFVKKNGDLSSSCSNLGFYAKTKRTSIKPSRSNHLLRPLPVSLKTIIENKLIFVLKHRFFVKFWKSKRLSMDSFSTVCWSSWRCCH
jgi:hypothetical protein